MLYLCGLFALMHALMFSSLSFAQPSLPDADLTPQLSFSLSIDPASPEILAVTCVCSGVAPASQPLVFSFTKDQRSLSKAPLDFVSAYKAYDAVGKVLSVSRKGRSQLEVGGASGPVVLSYQVRLQHSFFCSNPFDGARVDGERIIAPGRNILLVPECANASIRMQWDLPPGWTAICSAPDNPIGQDCHYFIGRWGKSSHNLDKHCLTLVYPDSNDYSVIPALTTLTRNLFAHYLQYAGDIPDQTTTLVFVPLDFYPKRIRTVSHISNSIVFFPWQFGKRETGDITKSESLLLAREIFRLWNGHYLRPESSFDSFWFQYSLTDYAAHQALGRLGLLSEADWLRWMEEKYVEYRQHPFYGEMTLEEAAKSPSQPEGMRFAYTAGVLKTFCLDIELQRQSKGKRAIRSLFSGLFQNSLRTRREYSLKQVYDMMAQVAGRAELPQSTLLVDTKTLPVATYLEACGISIVPVTHPQPFLGVILGEKGDKASILCVTQGPAKQAGVETGEQIIEVNDAMVSTVGDFGAFMQNAKAGDRLRLTLLSRDGKKRTVALVLDCQRSFSFKRQSPLLSEQQKLLRGARLGLD
jgi:PDZ domain